MVNLENQLPTQIAVYSNKGRLRNSQLASPRYALIVPPDFSGIVDVCDFPRSDRHQAGGRRTPPRRMESRDFLCPRNVPQPNPERCSRQGFSLGRDASGIDH